MYYYYNCAVWNCLSLGAEGLPRTSRQNWHSTWKNGCTGFKLRIINCVIHHRMVDRRAPERQGQGHCHWLIIRLPLRWRQLVSALTHSITHSPRLRVPGNTFPSELKVMSLSVLHITFFCSSPSVFSNTMQFLWSRWYSVMIMMKSWFFFLLTTKGGK